MKRVGVVSAAAALLVAALIGAGIALSGSESGAEFGTLSNRGSLVDSSAIVAKERQALETAGIGLNIRVLGERAGVRFYIGKSTATGRDCFITGLALSAHPHFGILGCASGQSAEFPSEEAPILDYSPQTAQRGDSLPHVQWLAGFAADGVASVGIVDTEGRVHETSVTGNIYATRDVPSGAAKEIVALDSSGQTIYTLPLKAPLAGS